MKLYRVSKGAVLKAVPKHLIMGIKLTFILMTIFLAQVSANSFGQRVTFGKKDATLKDVFKEIRKQTGYNVFWGSEKLSAGKTRDVNFKNESLDNVLKSLLSPQNLDYTIKNNTIVISQKNEQVYFKVKSFFEDITIKGKVTDQKGEPLPGATVTIKGAKRGAMTDGNGNYSLVVADKETILIVSFTGYISKEIRVGNQTSINIILDENVNVLGELVVVGYGTQSKAKITSAVSQVNTDLLQKAPVPNISNALEGLSPGLFVRQSSGEPGFSNSSFEIRNFGNALVIVDGTPGDINMLDPNEVESITVLKDAAAASVYGVQGGNGVVLVKTRRGADGKTKLTYSNQFTFNTPTMYPEYFNSADYATMSNQLLINAGQAPKYTPEQIEKYRDGSDPFRYPNTDWFKETLKTWSTQQQHNLNVAGGNKETKYFVSAGYINQGSLYKADVLNFKRYNIRANIDAKIVDNLNLSFNIAGRRTNKEAPGSSAYDIYRTLQRGLPTDLAYYPDGTPAKPTNSPSHPAEGMKNFNSGYYRDFGNNVDSKLSLKWDIAAVPGLSVTSFASIVYDNLYNKNWRKAYTLFTLNPTTGNYDPYVVAPEGASSNTILTENATYSNEYVLQQSLNYVRSFGDHNVTGLLVWETRKAEGNNFWGRRQDFQSTFIDQLFAGSNKNKDASGSQWRQNRVGLVGRATYDYKAKYLAEFAFRYDGSSRFAPGKNWGFFPSVSLGWRLSDEKFFAPLKGSIQDLKLRASVGTAGNDGTAAYQWLSGFTYNGFFVTSDEAIPTIDNSTLPNVNLTWANIVTYNGGLDLTVFNKTTVIGFDYFRRVQSDVLAAGSAQIPSTLGVGLAAKNLYKYKNEGFEISINHTNRISKDLSYNVGVNFSRSREKALFIDEVLNKDLFMRANLTQTGNFVSRSIGYVSDGLFQSQDEINKHAVQDNNKNATIKPGDIRYKDLNGDGIIDEKDTKVIGPGGKPDINYSLNLGITYKNFTLSTLLTGASGYTLYLDGEAQSAMKNGFNGFKYQMNYWTPENRDAPYPRPDGSNANNGKRSDFWQRSGTHLRVKNINLSYNLPKAFRDRLSLGDAKIFVTGYNLWVLKKMAEDFDPQWGGGNGFYYPQTKSFTFGLNLTI